MTDCIFCRILDGEVPGTFLHRDENSAVFMDTQPVNPGHLLVVPTAHASCLSDLSATTAGDLMQVAQQMAAALQQSDLRCEGVNLFLADGEAAGQEVSHVHLHVIPRFAGDGFGLHFGPHYETPPERDGLEQIADHIRLRLRAQ